MAKVKGTIPNFVNGVSQQAVALRLPSQAQASENYFPTVVDGLAKRPRTTWVAQLLANFDAENVFTHIYIRDAGEKYVAIFFNDGSIRVFDSGGTEHTVTNSAVAYLIAGTTPFWQRLKALTIADYTFIVNRDVTVATRSALSPTRPFEALYYVQAGNYSKTYSITINGAVICSYGTPDSGDVSHEPYVDTSYIAGQLFTLATGAGTAPWARGKYNSTVYISNSSADFTTSMADGYGGRASKAIHKTVQHFSDLPSDGPDGFNVKVTGSSNTGADDYWVTLSQGVWKESLAPGTRLGLDAATLPHTLRRNEDGTFTFAAHTWEDRTCGDVASVPDPSFVGQKIEDVTFFKNRLGMLTEQNVCLSESGSFYNFYRKTLTTILDTDPIDVAAAHTKVSLLKNSAILQGELMLFAAQTQFKLKGDQNDFLTPKTVSCLPLTEYIASENVRPVPSGSNLYFVAEHDGYAQLFEMYLDKARETGDAQPTTSHVPFYIQGGVDRLEASPDLNLVFLTTRAEPGTLYVYKYHFSGQEKVQSAWCKWRFPNASRIVNFKFDNGSILVLFLRGTQLHLERIRCEQRINDAPLLFQVGLDQYHKVAASEWVYDAVTDNSTATIPYDMPPGMLVISDFGGSVPGSSLFEGHTRHLTRDFGAVAKAMPFGVQRVPLNDNNDHQNDGARTVVIKGDWSSQPAIIGVPYASVHEFSPFYYSAPQPGGTKIVQTNGRTQIMDFNVVFSNTAYFRVEVTPQGREPRVYTYDSRILDAGSNKFGEMVILDGHFSSPIRSRNDRVVVKLINDSWLPSTFSQGEWRGMFNSSAREE